MSMNNFFGRIFQWLANEVIVKGLANNPSFQRFAVRTSQQAKELRKSAGDAVRNIADSQAAGDVRKESEQVRQAAGTFWTQIRREMESAMRDGGKGGPPRPPRNV